MPLKDHEIAELINYTTKSLQKSMKGAPRSLRQIVSHSVVEALSKMGAREDHKWYEGNASYVRCSDQGVLDCIHLFKSEKAIEAYLEELMGAKGYLNYLINTRKISLVDFAAKIISVERRSNEND